MCSVISSVWPRIVPVFRQYVNGDDFTSDGTATGVVFAKPAVVDVAATADVARKFRRDVDME